MCAVCARELASIFQSLLKQQRSGAPPPRPSREPGFPATPTRTPTHPGRRHPSLSALYLQHQREKPGAQAQCEPPQSGAGWGGEGAGAAAPSRPAKWQERQISLISGQLWCTRTPGSRPSPLFPTIPGESVLLSLLGGSHRSVHSAARQYGAVRPLPSPPLLRFCKLRAAGWTGTWCIPSFLTRP